ncbi:hypothetical protein E2562_017017 [Oryza meyeriana var. granulata]|uniref:Uncharacterized protein n=1 Tax=Oryza meyeriana var. granulata TaxID=110450 RepID=A0A6G1EAE9_9ORYZ|nr:hypothetical protein E2562_017017 [Oryza meyeriana var. granulata]
MGTHSQLEPTCQRKKGDAVWMALSRNWAWVAESRGVVYGRPGHGAHMPVTRFMCTMGRVTGSTR